MMPLCMSTLSLCIGITGSATCQPRRSSRRSPNPSQGCSPQARRSPLAMLSDCMRCACDVLCTVHAVHMKRTCSAHTTYTQRTCNMHVAHMPSYTPRATCRDLHTTFDGGMCPAGKARGSGFWRQPHARRHSNIYRHLPPGPDPPNILVITATFRSPPFVGPYECWPPGATRRSLKHAGRLKSRRGRAAMTAGRSKPRRPARHRAARPRHADRSRGEVRDILVVDPAFELCVPKTEMLQSRDISVITLAFNKTEMSLGGATGTNAMYHAPIYRALTYGFLL